MEREEQGSRVLSVEILGSWSAAHLSALPESRAIHPVPGGILLLILDHMLVALVI